MFQTTLTGIPCRFYGSAKGCRYGNNCGYSHANPQSIPLCKYNSSITGCRRDNQCHFRHCLIPNLRSIQSTSHQWPQPSPQQSPQPKEDKVMIKMESSPICKIMLKFIFAFNSDNIIAVAFDAIYRYNIYENVWRFYRKYPTEFKPHSIDSVAFDDENKHLYFITHQLSTVPFAPKSNQIAQRFAITDDDQLQIDSHKMILVRSGYRIRRICNSIVINGEYHVFTDNAHFVFNKIARKFSRIDSRISTDSDAINFGDSMIFYVSKTHMLICVAKSANSECITWVVFGYWLQEDKWEKLGSAAFLDKNILKYFQGTLTEGGQYIIILGKYENNNCGIYYILNLETMSMKQGPEFSGVNKKKFKAVLCVPSKTEIVIKGYSRIYIQISYIPDDIMSLIKLFYEDRNVIHLFESDNNMNHWKVFLQDILIQMQNL